MSTASRKRFNLTASLDLTSMIDVTFLLIIFFLCVTEMARVDYEELSLPLATRAVEDIPVPKNRQVINVVWEQDSGASRILLHGRTYEQTRELSAFLKSVRERAELRKEEPMSVKIRADSGAPYVEVQKVMVACAKAGISRISIGTAKERN